MKNILSNVIFQDFNDFRGYSSIAVNLMLALQNAHIHKIIVKENKIYPCNSLKLLTLTEFTHKSEGVQIYPLISNISKAMAKYALSSSAFLCL